MLDVDRIKKLFHALNSELRKQGVVGEVGICGGAVMCLVFGARPSTRDVDGVFHPTREIREACRKIAAEQGTDPEWLNDAAKAFFHVDPPREDVLNLSNLRVWAPTAEYMLAMKCVSARFDSFDRDDVVFLIGYLKLTQSEQVFDIIRKYYPDQHVPAKTGSLVREIMSAKA